MSERSTKFSTTLELTNFDNPFSLKEVFGFNKKIGFRLTLNENNELIMIYCMSNIICLLNVVQNTRKYITGHAFRLTRLVLNENGKILVSIDTRNIHIWNIGKKNDTYSNNDEKNCDVASILKIIKEPFGKHVEIAQAALSPCSRFLILVSGLLKSRGDYDEKKSPNYKIELWEWSFDRQQCDDMIEIFEFYGEVKHLIFNGNKGSERSYAITFDSKVIFGSITMDGKLSIYKPALLKSNDSIIRTIFVNNTDLALSATRNCKVIIWQDEIENIDIKIKKIDENLENENKNKILNNDKINCEKIKQFSKTTSFGDSQFTDMTTIDDYVVICNKQGEIMFFDKDLKLMYLVTTQQLTLGKSTLISIWGNIYKRNFEITDEAVIIQDEDAESKVTIPRHKCIQNYAGVGGGPFIVRKFFVFNEAGEVAMIDIVKNDFKMMLMPSEDNFIAMDIYPQKSWLISCTKNNRIIIYNYVSSNIIAKYHFITKNKPSKDKRKPIAKSIVTCIKVSYNENFVALGYDNGDLWMMDPVTGKETHEWPLKCADYAIKRIVFNKNNNNYCALADGNNAVVYIHFNGVRWLMLAKYQYHCMPIIGIFFFKYLEEKYIITIGYDRMYVRFKIYDNQADALMPEFDARLDQAPKLTAADLLDSRILEKDTSRSGSVLLIANNQCKFVFYDAYTTETLYTFLGPVFESPIQKIVFCPSRFDTNEKPMLLFTTKKSLGAAVLPLDGNPFRYSGILAHHTDITAFAANFDYTGVLIHGEGDVGPTYWEIQRDNIFNKLESGGKGLEPFLKLLPGGKHGQFFVEMIQFFYYIQLMEDSSDAPERKTITEFIKISEVIDYMRGIGFFPSEYEAKNVINEITRTKESWAAPPTHLSFTELIKLYFNHRPYDGYKFSKILDSLKYLLSGKLKFAVNDQLVLNSIDRNQLLEVMTTKGEKIPPTQAMRYLLELLDVEDRGIKRKMSELNDVQVLRNFKKLPEEINIHEFCYKVFGMESMDAEKMTNIFERVSLTDHGSVNLSADRHMKSKHEDESGSDTDANESENVDSDDHDIEDKIQN